MNNPNLELTEELKETFRFFEEHKIFISADWNPKQWRLRPYKFANIPKEIHKTKPVPEDFPPKPVEKQEDKVLSKKELKAKKKAEKQALKEQKEKEKKGKKEKKNR